MLFLLLGWLGWVEWQEYDFRGAVREAEAAGFDFRQSPSPIALIRADWHAAFRSATWFARERKLWLPEECDLAPLRPLLLRLGPTTLWTMRCRNAGAIRGLTGLHELDLICSDIKDLTPLAGMKRLQRLNLEYCFGVANIAPLAGLTQLRILNLSECKFVTDLAPLAALTQLQRLDLRRCAGVVNLGPLAGLIQLREFRLSECEVVTDLTPLAGLTQLQFLYLTDCTRVADIAPLAGLVQLEWLDLLGCMGVSAEAKAAFRKRHPKTIGIGF